jgi:hypothetical protein
MTDTQTTASDSSQLEYLRELFQDFNTNWRIKENKFRKSLRGYLEKPSRNGHLLKSSQEFFASSAITEHHFNIFRERILKIIAKVRLDGFGEAGDPFSPQDYYLFTLPELIFKLCERRLQGKLSSTEHKEMNESVNASYLHKRGLGTRTVNRLYLKLLQTLFPDSCTARGRTAKSNSNRSTNADHEDSLPAFITGNDENNTDNSDDLVSSFCTSQTTPTKNNNNNKTHNTIINSKHDTSNGSLDEAEDYHPSLFSLEEFTSPSPSDPSSTDSPNVVLSASLPSLPLSQPPSVIWNDSFPCPSMPDLMNCVDLTDDNLPVGEDQQRTITVVTKKDPVIEEMKEGELVTGAKEEEMETPSLQATSEVIESSQVTLSVDCLSKFASYIRIQNEPGGSVSSFPSQSAGNDNDLSMSTALPTRKETEWQLQRQLSFNIPDLPISESNQSPSFLTPHPPLDSMFCSVKSLPRQPVFYAPLFEKPLQQKKRKLIMSPSYPLELHETSDDNNDDVRDNVSEKKSETVALLRRETLAVQQFFNTGINPPRCNDDSPPVNNDPDDQHLQSQQPSSSLHPASQLQIPIEKRLNDFSKTEKEETGETETAVESLKEQKRFGEVKSFDEELFVTIIVHVNSAITNPETLLVEKEILQKGENEPEKLCLRRTATDDQQDRDLENNQPGIERRRTEMETNDTSLDGDNNFSNVIHAPDIDSTSTAVEEMSLSSRSPSGQDLDGFPRGDDDTEGRGSPFFASTSQSVKNVEEQEQKEREEVMSVEKSEMMVESLNENRKRKSFD